MVLALGWFGGFGVVLEWLQRRFGWDLSYPDDMWGFRGYVHCVAWLALGGFGWLVGGKF